MGSVYEDSQAVAELLKERLGGELGAPEVAIICGSGLGGIVDVLTGPKVEVAYEDIPNFRQSTVAGHAGKLVAGFIGQVPVLCMAGRLQ
jgi:purine-nucleoside phosphorylase